MPASVKHLRLNKGVTVQKNNYNVTYVLPRPRKRKYVEIVSTVPAFSWLVCKKTNHKILYMDTSSLAYNSLENNILMFNNSAQMIKLIGLSHKTWLLVTSFSNIITVIPDINVVI
jgi:metal-dependent hydrolase (beta-lactamase superfamily II)